MDKIIKKESLIPHTKQQEVEKKAKNAVDVVVENEVLLTEHRAHYERLVLSARELTGKLETAKRNNDQVEMLKIRQELHTTQSAIKQYDEQFHKSSVEQAVELEKAEETYEERNRHLN